MENSPSLALFNPAKSVSERGLVTSPMGSGYFADPHETCCPIPRPHCWDYPRVCPKLWRSVYLVHRGSVNGHESREPRSLPRPYTSWTGQLGHPGKASYGDAHGHPTSTALARACELAAHPMWSALQPLTRQVPRGAFSSKNGPATRQVPRVVGCFPWKMGLRRVKFQYIMEDFFNGPATRQIPTVEGCPPSKMGLPRVKFQEWRSFSFSKNGRAFLLKKQDEIYDPNTDKERKEARQDLFVTFFQQNTRMGQIDLTHWSDSLVWRPCFTRCRGKKNVYKMHHTIWIIIFPHFIFYIYFIPDYYYPKSSVKQPVCSKCENRSKNSTPCFLIIAVLDKTVQLQLDSKIPDLHTLQKSLFSHLIGRRPVQNPRHLHYAIRLATHQLAGVL